MYLLRRGDMISLADARLEVVVEGHRRNYRVTVELPGAAPLEEESKPSPRTAATEPALVLAAHERRLLAAICGPLLVGRGAREPASYEEAARRLGVSHTLRNKLDELRGRLMEQGVPGVEGPQAKDRLAHYAVASGSITLADVQALGPSRAGSDGGATGPDH